MQTQDNPAAQTRPRPRRSPGAELTGPPRPSVRAQVSVALFTVLLVAVLVAPSVTATEPLPGLALVCLGMVLLGVAELIDASSRGFLIAVRLGGIAIALLGFLLQVL